MIVLDTNIFLQDATLLYTYKPDEILILPEVVIDELDTKKSGNSDLAYQAREAGRILTKAKIVRTVSTVEHTITTIDIGRTILVISKHAYQAKGDAKILNDRKIIEIAKDFNALFITNDAMAKLRAVSEGVETDSIELVDDSEIETFKTLDIETFEDIETIPVELYDEDYHVENCSYLLRTPDGNQHLAIVVHGRFQLINEAELHKQ